MAETYVTLKGYGEAKEEIQKSVFLGYASHVTTEKEAVDFINQIKKKHSDATHNVYAYMLKDGNITRYSDDGEPQGTAGLPVLDIIRKTGFIDAVIVVTRYFGGTLLGKGGLVRAYSGTAKLACEAAKIVEYRKRCLFSLDVGYDMLEKVRYEYQFYDISEEGCDYSDGVHLTLTVLLDKKEEFFKKLADISSGKLTPREKDTVWSEA